MRILIFGATGMVGQGVLRECLLDPAVDLVQTVGRTSTGLRDAKLREVIHSDLWNYAALDAALNGFDACFFCLGVSSAGMDEPSYRKVTYDLTLAAATKLCAVNPAMTFVYVSGAGTDGTGKGRTMWARVKGETENALLRLPFHAAYMFRPGFIEPLHGARSKTRAYRILYGLSRPLIPLLRGLFPNSILTTEQIGRAMLASAKQGAPVRVLESKDIRALGG